MDSSTAEPAAKSFTFSHVLLLYIVINIMIWLIYVTLKRYPVCLMHRGDMRHSPANGFRLFWWSTGGWNVSMCKRLFVYMKTKLRFSIIINNIMNAHPQHWRWIKSMSYLSVPMTSCLQLLVCCKDKCEHELDQNWKATMNLLLLWSGPNEPNSRCENESPIDFISMSLTCKVRTFLL